MTATVVTHVYNESFMMPFWLKHHRELFDRGVVIDYASTDNTVDIVHELAPHWEVRQSRNKCFAAIACDHEVMAVEREVAGWKMALTVTEFLYVNDLSAMLEDVGDYNAARIRPVAMVDTSERSNLTDAPLTDQCHTGFMGGYMEPYKSRMIHRYNDGAYSVGRHSSRHSDVQQYPDGALLLWFGFAPWCDAMRQRKLQIQSRIPLTDQQAGYGVQHLMNDPKLHATWQEHVRLSGDLRRVPEYAAVIG